MEKKISLDCADLSGADLAGADLSKASLCSADLCGANLRNADLMGAQLENADLTGANCVGTNFAQASIANAAFDAADLSNANLFGVFGIERCHLRGAAGLHDRLIDGGYCRGVRVLLTRLDGDEWLVRLGSHTTRPHYVPELLRDVGCSEEDTRELTDMVESLKRRAAIRGLDATLEQSDVDAPRF